MNDRTLSMLSLCRKAGKMVTGFDVVKESILDGKASLILLASDLSPKTDKEIRYMADKNAVKVHTVQYTMNDLWFVLGKRTGIVAVTDGGFADKISQML